MIDCCLAPHEQVSSYVMARTSYIECDDDVSLRELGGGGGGGSEETS